MPGFIFSGICDCDFCFPKHNASKWLQQLLPLRTKGARKDQNQETREAQVNLLTRKVDPLDTMDVPHPCIIILPEVDIRLIIPHRLVCHQDIWVECLPMADNMVAIGVVTQGRRVTCIQEADPTLTCHQEALQIDKDGIITEMGHPLLIHQVADVMVERKMKAMTNL